jgi:hypothetical protein
MVEREKIQRGTRLTLLGQRDGVASGTLARVDTVREENRGAAWGFSVYWDDYRKRTDTACSSPRLTWKALRWPTRTVRPQKPEPYCDRYSWHCHLLSAMCIAGRMFLEMERHGDYRSIWLHVPTNVLGILAGETQPTQQKSIESKKEELEKD